MNGPLKFKYSSTSIPQDADPEVEEIFNFYISGPSDDEIKEKDSYCWDVLKNKATEKPRDAFITLTVSIASFRRRQFETALVFIIRSIILEPMNTFPYRLLMQYMKFLNYGDLEPMYAVHAAQGLKPVVKYLLEFAEQCFENDDLVSSDFYIQRAICLYSADGEQPEFFAQALEKTQKCLENGTYDKDASELIENQHNFIKFEDKAAIKRFTKRWLKDPNKKMLAKYVSRLLSKNKICVGLGCHSGALLSMIQKRCKDNLIFIGIDPDRKAILHGKKTFKGIQFIDGDARDMASGQIELPEKFDVLLLSDICLLLKQEDINEIFAFARERCKQIVIMDDIVNMFGNFSVFRRMYFLHPYKKMLEENGFEIIDKQFLPKPNWANSGILLAQRIGTVFANITG